MFCPKCAANNEDDTKFCRSCGQDISLALRGLKGHSALVVAGKVDQLFDRHNEGLLWTGVLGVLLFLASAVLIGIELYQGQAGAFPLLFFLQCTWMMMGLGGVLNFVAYRRSLRPQSRERPDTNAGLFCPACGSRNAQQALACAACDQSLEGLSSTQGRAPKGWFYRFIDSSTNFSRRDVKYQKQGIFAFFGGFFFLLFSLPFAYSYGFPLLPSINLLILSIFFFGVGFWRYIAEKRVVLSPE